MNWNLTKAIGVVVGAELSGLGAAVEDFGMGVGRCVRALVLDGHCGPEDYNMEIARSEK